MDSVQARIVALKNRAQARRQVKPISGSSMHFTITKSPQFTIYMPGTDTGKYTGIKWLKFIPNNHKPGYFYFNVNTEWDHSMTIRPGSIGSDGSVAIVVNASGDKLYSDSSTTFSLTAVGVTSGTFIEL